MRDRILDAPRRRHHGTNAGVAERVDVRLCCARVEHDELQPTLTAEERGETTGIGDGRGAIGGFEQQPFWPGMSREVQNADPVAIRVVLKDAHHLLRRRIRQRNDLADAAALCLAERRDDVVELEAQAPEMPRPHSLVRGRDENDGRSTLYRCCGGRRRVECRRRGSDGVYGFLTLGADRIR